LLEADGHRVDALRIQGQAIEEGRGTPRVARGAHVVVVRGDQLVGAGPQRLRPGAERGVLVRRRRARDRRRCGAGSATEGDDVLLEAHEGSPLAWRVAGSAGAVLLAGAARSAPARSRRTRSSRWIA